MNSETVKYLCLHILKAIAVTFVVIVVLMVMGCFDAQAAEPQHKLPELAKRESVKVPVILHLQNGELVTVDAFGRVRHDKPKYRVEGKCFYEADVFGRTQYNKNVVCVK